MKKLHAFILSLIVVYVIVFIGSWQLKKYVIANSDKLVYANVVERNDLTFLMNEIIDSNSILVLGSSELSSSDTLAYPNYLYNGGNSDYRIIPVGRGNNQSLFHAISVASLANSIKNNKVVMILSPQWFTKENTNSQIFSSRFSETMYVNFLKNSNISKENKKKIAKRVETLLENDLPQQKRVEEMNSLYFNNIINRITYIKYNIYNYFMNLKKTYNFYKIMSKYYQESTYSDKMISASEIDYEDLMIKAEETGIRECTNNEYGIYDDYFNKYVKSVYDEYKNSQVNDSYIDSLEYEDLKLFLDVCKDLKLDVMLISIPVNGLWYDYTGFPKDNREKYYENIRQISKDYAVKLADFSDKEYEKYFLRDIMHIGWKGWVYVDEAIYKFYQGKF